MNNQTKNQSRNGRPRTPLHELHHRWSQQGRQRKIVEGNVGRSLNALFNEMLAFMPGGIVDDASLAWFLVRYQSELPHIFHPPFARPPTAAEIERSDNAEAALREIGRPQDTAGMVTIVQARMAYHMAQMHAWRRNGSTGTPPSEPGVDDDQWFEREIKTLERFREAATGRSPARETDQPTRPSATPQANRRQPPAPPHGEAPAEDMPDLGDETTDRPIGDDWGDHVTWDGKEQTMSPRDAMRPYLEASGRLDLLDRYDDEIIQYGPVVRRWIGGKLR